MSLSEAKYLTYREVAKILRCSERTLQNRVKSGELQSFSNGRLRLFTEEDVKAYMNRNASRTQDSQSETQNN